jgi:hypothetical protein
MSADQGTQPIMNSMLRILRNEAELFIWGRVLHVKPHLLGIYILDILV